MPSSDAGEVTPRRPSGGTDDAPRFRPGAQVLNYRILAVLGRGAMGEVFHARDEKLRREVALKFVAPRIRGSHDALMRLEREAQTAAKISHPNVVRIFDLAHLDGEPFIVAEYIDGDDLYQLIRKGTPPIVVAMAVLRQIAAGLAAAHAVGIVHRDIKPQNIRLRTDSSVVIVDFGLGKALLPDPDSASPTDAQLTNSGHMVGTVSYSAPEQLRDGARVSGAADVFSLGVLAFELLTGRRPFDRSNIPSTIAAIMYEDAPDIRSRRPDVTNALAHLIQDCLSKGTGTRPTAADIALRLDELSRGAGTPAQTPVEMQQATSAPETPTKDHHSAREWKALLRKVIVGEGVAAIRDDEVEEYIRLRIQSAPDPAAAEDAFIGAVEDELARWRPSLPINRRANVLLEIINAFLPPAGFVKACELLESESGPPERTAACLRALAALARYFPAPPLDGSANLAFRHYVRVLTSLIESESLAARAAAQLIDLDVVDLSNEEIRQKARTDEGFLRELVTYFVSPARRVERVRMIFELCNAIGASGLAVFLAAVEQSGSTAILGPESVSFVSGGAETRAFELKIDPSQLESYMVARWHLLANDRRVLDRLLEDKVP
jgi:serine/threonine protein kinase